MAGWTGWIPVAFAGGADSGTNVFAIRSINVNRNDVRLTRGGEVSLGAEPEDIYFYFNVATNGSAAPVRIRTKLDGYDKDWQEGAGEMHLAVRFCNDAGDLTGQSLFNVTGTSAGWTGSLKTSALTHRREMVVAPPQASRLVVIISSAGPPATLGIYAVANLTVSKTAGDLAPTVLLQSPLEEPAGGQDSEPTPAGWIRDGNRPSMARVVRLGREPATPALAILDDSLISHAEWHNELATAPKVTAGDQLVIEWNEMYSIGVGDTRVVLYKTLPPGRYEFQAEAVDLMGARTGDELLLAVRVPLPFWKTYWFWGGIFVAVAVLAVLLGRYLTLRKVRGEMVRLEMQHLLEHERMRISRDIHDDLGARVTQISLVSAMARNHSHDPEQSRRNFDQISEMSRDLVAALYETVWAVNPENDNLNELGTYLFQMINKLCEQTTCRCRFYIQELPREVVVPSQIRHHICMAVKEATTNIKKHAHATEITVHVDFIGHVLTIVIQDDGCGFEPGEVVGGHGLKNLRRRLEEIGGICQISSAPGKGTTIKMQIGTKPPSATRPTLGQQAANITEI